MLLKTCEQAHSLFFFWPMLGFCLGEKMLQCTNVDNSVSWMMFADSLQISVIRPSNGVQVLNMESWEDRPAVKVVRFMKLPLQCFLCISASYQGNAHPNCGDVSIKNVTLFEGFINTIQDQHCSKKDRLHHLQCSDILWRAGLSLFQNKRIYGCTKITRNHDVGFRSWCWIVRQMKKQPWISPPVHSLLPQLVVLL